VETNQLLYSVIQNLPDPKIPSTETPAQQPGTNSTVAPTPTTSQVGAFPVSISGGHGSSSTAVAAAPTSSNVAQGVRKDAVPSEGTTEGFASRRKSSDAISDGLRASTALAALPAAGSIIKPKSLAVSPGPSEPQTPIAFEYPNRSRPGSPSGIPIPIANPATSSLAQQQSSATAQTQTQATERDPFDIRETVNVLTLQFVSEHEETRIAALEWLSMLHQKAPSEVCSSEGGLHEND
jgi:vacuole morphology and inheritance protein 14